MRPSCARFNDNIVYGKNILYPRQCRTRHITFIYYYIIRTRNAHRDIVYRMLILYTRTDTEYCTAHRNGIWNYAQMPLNNAAKRVGRLCIIESERTSVYIIS